MLNHRKISLQCVAAITKLLTHCTMQACLLGAVDKIPEFSFIRIGLSGMASRCFLRRPGWLRRTLSYWIFVGRTLLRFL
jgi:hypothetical protein